MLQRKASVGRSVLDAYATPSLDDVLKEGEQGVSLSYLWGNDRPGRERRPQHPDHKIRVE